MHSSPPADLQQTDTYFIVAHFHYVLFGGSMMGLLAGVYYYFPKITGRMMNERLGKWHFWLTFIGINLTFFPMHFSGWTACRAASTRTMRDRAGSSTTTMSHVRRVHPRLRHHLRVQLVRSRTQRRDRRQRSVGRADARVVHPVAAAGVQLRRDPDGDVALSALGREVARAHGRRAAYGNGDKRTDSAGRRAGGTPHVAGPPDDGAERARRALLERRELGIQMPTRRSSRWSSRSADADVRRSDY